jgi:23S rRNA (cytosine1962-C5)-methyltransferase
MNSLPHLPKQLILRNKEEGRVVAGHPWVFSNEVRETRGSPAIGDIVELVAASGVSLGIGLYNPHSLIAFRLLAPTIVDVDHEFFRQRFATALALREKLYPGATTYRLVHGEGDFLSGLVIDRFNGQFAIQTFSYGMDQRLPLICDVLREMFQPSCIIARDESPLRALENLPLRRTVIYGEPTPVVITENGVSYTVDLRGGQKTGFFLDQRENRAALARFCPGKRVLDAFCNDGGFSLTAGRAGAASVMGIDISADAVSRARANASLNALHQVTFREQDVFDALKILVANGEKFDVVVLDPPSFTKSKKNVQTAKKGYRDLHASVFPLLPEDSVLLTASCSHHILPEVFLSIVDDSARKAGRRVQLLEWRGAAPDHPTLPAVPETRYLKAGIFRVL